MNRQIISDERSKALPKAIVEMLRNNPNLWEIPKRNLLRWEKMKGRLSPAFEEWEYIFNNNSEEQILSILESDSENSIRLRSSSPFTGILIENERRKIFLTYKH